MKLAIKIHLLNFTWFCFNKLPLLQLFMSYRP